VTHSGRVGVLATPTTFAGELYAALVDRFAQGIEIFQSTCPGLVEEIERGELESPAIRAILEGALTPMLAEGVDTIVLGCTHYPFVIPVIEVHHRSGGAHDRPRASDRSADPALAVRACLAQPG
jgi:glutamate racemase